VNENDLEVMRSVTWLRWGGGTRGTYAIGEISDQVVNGQAPCLQLVIQPNLGQLCIT
jgi:hypothetical protein